MQPQVQGLERTIKVDKAALAAWLAELFSRQGPGVYIVVLGDGRLIVKKQQQPKRFEYSLSSNVRA